MAAIGKRFLNVLVLLPTAYLLTLLYLVITGGVADWNVFLFINGGLLLLCYGAIAAFNYIFFDELTLWHRKPSGRDR